VVDLLVEGLNGVVGATFAVEADCDRAAAVIRRHIEGKRKLLGLPHVDPKAVPLPPL
jgi:anaerobic carbon-monoxide dehydrogenase catalytic subunit